MFLSRTTFSRTSALVTLAGAAAAWLSFAVPAAAQQPRNFPRIPLDAKGYQTSQILQEYHRQREAAPALAARPTPPVAARPAAAEPTAVAVTVTRLAEAPALYVDLRGPDGSVRRFPVEGGRAAIQTQTVTVHAGEALTLHLAVANRGK